MQDRTNASASDRAGVSRNEHTRGTVILLHGFVGLPIMSRPQARMLRRAGFETRELGYDSWGKSLAQICDRLLPRIARIAERSDGPVHFVGHSMGGLVIRALLSRWRPVDLGHVVMLGTPNAGSEVADFVDSWAVLRPILGQAGPALVTRRSMTVEKLFGPIDYSLGIIAGDWNLPGTPFSRLFDGAHDGKVSVASTWLPEAADHIVLPLPHTLLLYHRDAHSAARHFLIHGRFAEDAQRDYP
ncbi:MAG: alpha/beta fold hydrolase [Sphingobium sp.]|nr:alpha/beta fold hydrolase [Sphingobium sp.]